LSIRHLRVGAQSNQARQIVLRETVGDFEPRRVMLDEDVLVRFIPRSSSGRPSRTSISPAWSPLLVAMSMATIAIKSFEERAMESERIDFAQILQRAGFKTGALRRLKLKQGPAGQMTTVGVAAIVCITVVAFVFPPSLAMKGMAIFLIAALAFYLLWRLENLTRERPETTMLEGAELLLSPPDARSQSRACSDGATKLAGQTDAVASGDAANPSEPDKGTTRHDASKSSG
jgi:hypothetical protein